MVEKNRAWRKAMKAQLHKKLMRVETYYCKSSVTQAFGQQRNPLQQSDTSAQRVAC